MAHGDWLIRRNFRMSAGGEANFKIECDGITETEIRTFAKLISDKVKFSAVYGIPSGGTRIAQALERYIEDKYPVLIVDDVYTTGASMRKYRDSLCSSNGDGVIGIVLFARFPIVDPWVKAVFQYWDEKSHDQGNPNLSSDD